MSLPQAQATNEGTVLARLVVPGQRRLGWEDVVLLAMLLATSLSLFVQLSRPRVLLYDEADYMLATEAGLWANYWEPRAISLQAFVEMGLRKGMDKRSEAELSTFIRSSGDLGIYRHYHAPLYFQYARLLRPILCPGNSLASPVLGKEHRIRWASALCYTALIAVVYVGTYRSSPAMPRASAVLASGVVALSSATLTMGTFFSPHSLFALLCTSSLLGMAAMLRDNSSRRWPWCATLVGLAALTIEYGILLYLTLLASLWMVSGTGSLVRRTRDWSLLTAKCTGLIIVLVAVLWPAGLLKAQLLRCYIVYAYNAFIRNADYYGSIGLGELWWRRLAGSPVEYGLLGFGLASLAWTLWFRRQTAMRWLIPLALYAVLQICTTLRNRSELVQYVSALLPAACILGTVMLMKAIAQTSRPTQVTTMALLMAAALAHASLVTVPAVKSSIAPGAGDLLMQEVLNGDPPRRLLAEQRWLPLLTYYMRETQVVRTDARTAAELRDEMLKSGADVAVWGGGTVLSPSELSPMWDVSGVGEGCWVIRRR